jgi:hypothetical protein
MIIKTLTQTEYEILCFYDPKIPKEFDLYSLDENYIQRITFNIDINAETIPENIPAYDAIVSKLFYEYQYINYEPSEGVEVNNVGGFRYSIISATHKRYIITQSGIKARDEYKKNKDISDRKELVAIEKAELDFKAAKWSYRMRAYPFLVSGLALIVSILAYKHTMIKDSSTSTLRDTIYIEKKQIPIKTNKSNAPAKDTVLKTGSKI